MSTLIINLTTAIFCSVVSVILYSKYAKKPVKYLPKEKTKDFTLVLISPESDNLMESFGITQERIDYLIDKSNEIARKYIDKTEKGISINAAMILEEISKECLHQNELAVVSLQIGGSIATVTRRNPGDYLRDILNNLEN